MPDLLLYGGKGGVGKTTCAAATGLGLAPARETLVVSTDPAHSLADAVEEDLGGDPTAVAEGLYGLETDPATGTERYRRLFEALADQFDRAGLDLEAEGVQELFGTGGLPGGDELAALSAIADHGTDDRWDVVVLDTAPTGHTLRLLDLPEAVGTGVRTAASLREQVRRKTDAARTMVLGPWGLLASGADDAAGERIDALAEEMETVASLLRDPDRTAFRVVFTPERLVVAETRRLVDRLREHGVPLGPLVANRVLESPDPGCERCQAEARRHASVLETVTGDPVLGDLETITLPDLTGVEGGRPVLSALAGPLTAVPPAAGG